MTPTTIWWVLAGLAVVAQLMTGTFHFLMLAAALAAGALTAMLGGTLILQLLAVAVVGAGAVVAETGACGSAVWGVSFTASDTPSII